MCPRKNREGVLPRRGCRLPRPGIGAESLPVATATSWVILTAEFGHPEAGVDPRGLVIELAVLSGLIVAIAVSLFVLRRKDTTDKVARA